MRSSELRAAIERHNRARVALWAYAYEIEHSPLVSDAVFDDVCANIDISIDTGDTVLDTFFKTEFAPCTGCWVYRHPHLARLEQIFNQLTFAHETPYGEPPEAWYDV